MLLGFHSICTFIVSWNAAVYVEQLSRKLGLCPGRQIADDKRQSCVSSLDPEDMLNDRSQYTLFEWLLEGIT